MRSSMKIAIIYKGIVRGPNVINNWNSSVFSKEDAEWCEGNIKTLNDSFQGHEIETFMFSWNIPNTLELVSKNVVDNMIILKQPTTEDAGKIVHQHTSQHGPGSNKVALYGQFMGLQITLNSIKNMESKYLNKFDYICVSRPDLRIKLTNIETWMTDSLVMPDIERYPLNDQFYIASYEQMMKLKDVTVDYLNQILVRSSNSENALENIFNQHKIPFNFSNNFSEYKLRCITQRWV